MTQVVGQEAEPERLPSSVAVQGSIQSSVGPQHMSLSTAVRRSVLSCSPSMHQRPSAATAIPDGLFTFLCLQEELLERFTVGGLLHKEATSGCSDDTGPRDGEGAGCWCYHEHLLQAGNPLWNWVFLKQHGAEGLGVFLKLLAWERVEIARCHCCCQRLSKALEGLCCR